MGELAKPLHRAAQYVRMSTEHQRYSALNQIDAIHEYAAQRNISVVKTYADKGKSGLRLKNRPALQKLLQDVVSGNAEFTLILVYDVSRWGRFQDVDEAAHYEFVCRQAGINIEYCAEQFDNDGNPMSTLLKSMKRIMAAEFSRELSVKTFLGQRRIASMGYRTGAAAGYGLRRHLVDARGKHRTILQTGQQKVIATDRTILAPGPSSEVAVVERIFRACAAGKSYEQIATELNKRDKNPGREKPWREWDVGYLLRNEKYAGDLVWNKHSSRLGEKRITNPKSEWIRVDGAFKPVISRELFDEARQAVRRRMAGTSEGVLIEGLKRLLEEKGHLTKEMIRADKRIPGPAAYERCFGNILEAYKRVGFESKSTYGTDLDKELFNLNLQRTADVAEKLLKDGEKLSWLRGRRGFEVDGKYIVQFMVLRSYERESGGHHWQLMPKAKQTVDVLVTARMDHNNQTLRDFLLLPRSEVRGVSIRIIEGANHPFETYRSKDLEPLYTMLGAKPDADMPVRDSILEAIRETKERARLSKQTFGLIGQQEHD